MGHEEKTGRAVPPRDGRKWIHRCAHHLRPGGLVLISSDQAFQAPPPPLESCGLRHSLWSGTTCLASLYQDQLYDPNKVVVKLMAS